MEPRPGRTRGRRFPTLGSLDVRPKFRPNGRRLRVLGLLRIGLKGVVDLEQVGLSRLSCAGCGRRIPMCATCGTHGCLDPTCYACLALRTGFPRTALWITPLDEDRRGPQFEL